MRLLMFYTEKWWYRTASKSLELEPDNEGEDALDNAVAIFWHAEAEDEERRKSVVQKFLKNVKWLAGKFGTKHVVLHSFNHLGMSKSSPGFARDVLEEVRSRLEGTGYTVLCTPFGYFNEFSMHVAGDSLAKVYKEI